MNHKQDKSKNQLRAIEEAGDELRRKSKYRKLVLMQGVKMPVRLAMKMVGPDCAYHLYRQHMPNTDDSSK